MDVAVIPEQVRMCARAVFLENIHPQHHPSVYLAMLAHTWIPLKVARVNHVRRANIRTKVSLVVVVVVRVTIKI